MCDAHVGRLAGSLSNGAGPSASSLRRQTLSATGNAHAEIARPLTHSIAQFVANEKLRARHRTRDANGHAHQFAERLEPTVPIRSRRGSTGPGNWLASHLDRDMVTG